MATRTDCSARPIRSLPPSDLHKYIQLLEGRGRGEGEGERGREGGGRKKEGEREGGGRKREREGEMKREGKKEEKHRRNREATTVNQESYIHSKTNMKMLIK